MHLFPFMLLYLISDALKQKYLFYSEILMFFRGKKDSSNKVCWIKSVQSIKFISNRECLTIGANIEGHNAHQGKQFCNINPVILSKIQGILLEAGTVINKFTDDENILEKYFTC